MELETKRLRLAALTPRQLALWIQDISKLESELNCTYQAEPINGMFKEILLNQLEIAKADSLHYLWHSFWFIIRKSDNIVIGSADFKDVPDEKGIIEVGYGLGKAFEHHGYMTEAVRTMCAWAVEQTGVKHLVAETDIDGFASQRVLQRCGFSEILRNTSVWWQL